MNDIGYTRVDSVSGAIAAGQASRGAMYLAGGTTVVDLLREGVFAPEAVIDVGPLPLRGITVDREAISIGALVPNSEIAWNPAIQAMFPVVSQAILAGASGQIRNMASTGGNVLQRTRCPYYRDLTASCNKRSPGTGCAAYEGYNRSHAILGGSEHCIATHASDFAVALTAVEARIQLAGADGEREVPISEFYLLPGATPQRENVLRPNELIVAVKLPHPAGNPRSHYLKVRDRHSYEFALASAAVIAELDGGALRNVRIALGGIATVPWRAHAAEQLLEGQPPSQDAFKAAAESALAGAVPREHNRFKIPLAQSTLISALSTLTGIA